MSMNHITGSMCAQYFSLSSAPETYNIYDGSRRIRTFSAVLRNIRSGYSGSMGMNMSGGGFNQYSALDRYTMNMNAKASMQNLNDRLASYMDRIKSLEASKARLEQQICEYYEKKKHVVQKDCSAYWAIINDLKDKIKNATSGITNICLQTDNATLAKDDFRTKYENEQMMQQLVEAENANFRQVIDQATLCKLELETQVESLQREMILLKKNPLKELAALRDQLSGTVNVEVKATSRQDLNKVMEEIRTQYENITAKQRIEQEAWFNDKTAALNTKVAIITKSIQTSKTEISDLKKTLQGLKIELQSQLSMKAALDNSLAEREACSSAILQGYKNQINMLEEDLAQKQVYNKQRSHDYKMQLDLKSCMEQEIATHISIWGKEETRQSVTDGTT